MLMKLQTTLIALLLFSAGNAAQAEPLGAHPPMFLLQAEQALESGNPTRTIALLQRRYKRLLAPDDRIRGYAALCSAYLSEQNLRLADWACGHATKMDLAGWSDFNNRGVLELHLGRFDDALASFEHAQSLNPDAESVKNNISRARAIRENRRVSSAQ